MTAYLELLEYRAKQVKKENNTIIDIWSKLTDIVTLIDSISYHENAKEAENFSSALVILSNSFDKTFSVEEKIALKSIGVGKCQ